MACMVNKRNTIYKRRGTRSQMERKTKLSRAVASGGHGNLRSIRLCKEVHFLSPKTEVHSVRLLFVFFFSLFNTYHIIALPLPFLSLLPMLLIEQRIYNFPQKLAHITFHLAYIVIFKFGIEMHTYYALDVHYELLCV